MKRDDDEMKGFLDWMKAAGIVPTGKGQPLQPGRMKRFFIMFDLDYECYFLHSEGNCWQIRENGAWRYLYWANIHEMPPRQKLYYDYQFEDHVELPVIQTVFKLMDRGV